MEVNLTTSKKEVMLPSVCLFDSKNTKPISQNSLERWHLDYHQHLMVLW